MNTLALRRLDTPCWPAASAAGKLASFVLAFRDPDPRPLILRPGGMGDLILLTIAVEELGLDPRGFFWVVERRSRIWAKHLGLDHVCYDDGPLGRHLGLAGRFSTVINSEQRFGLSQATALLACGPRATLTCFATNRAAFWARRRVPYDPDGTHETVAFQKLLAAALGIPGVRNRTPERHRMTPAGELPVVGLGGLQAASRAFLDEEWARLIRSWIGAGRFRIASSEADRPFARRLQMRFGARASVFEGNFAELCTLIRRSENVFTVDGGFLHIASYYGVPATAVFTSGRERKWSPLAPGSRIVRRSGLACQPCTWFGQVPKCRHNFACKELHVEPLSATRAGSDIVAEPRLLPAMRA